MKDYDNFFDEMIDVDDEAEAEPVEYADEGEDFDDGDEDDDDDALVVRTAVLTKNDMLALLSLKSSDEGGQIVRFDQREPLDRKSTRLNSSHANIPYALFCLTKTNDVNHSKC